MIRVPMSAEKLAEIHKRERAWRISGEEQTAGQINLDRNDLVAEVYRLLAAAKALQAEAERLRAIVDAPMRIERGEYHVLGQAAATLAKLERLLRAGWGIIDHGPGSQIVLWCGLSVARGPTLAEAIEAAPEVEP